MTVCNLSIFGTKYVLFIDVDECLQENHGGCEQTCVNTYGSYHCNCFVGYELKPDHQTCKGMDNSSSIDQSSLFVLVENKALLYQCLSSPTSSISCICAGTGRMTFTVCVQVLTF